MADMGGIGYFVQGLNSGLKNTGDMLNDWEKLKLAKQEAERKKQLEYLTQQQALFKDIKENPENAVNVLSDPSVYSAYGLSPEAATRFKDVANQSLAIKKLTQSIQARLLANDPTAKQDILKYSDVLSRTGDLKVLHDMLQQAEGAQVGGELHKGLQGWYAQNPGQEPTPSDLINIHGQTSNPQLSMELFSKNNPYHAMGGLFNPEQRQQLNDRAVKAYLLNRLARAFQGDTTIDKVGITNELQAMGVKPDELMNNPYVSRDIALQNAYKEGIASHFNKYGGITGENAGENAPVGSGPVPPGIPQPGQSGVLPSPIPNQQRFVPVPKQDVGPQGTQGPGPQVLPGTGAMPPQAPPQPRPPLAAIPSNLIPPGQITNEHTDLQRQAAAKAHQILKEAYGPDVNVEMKIIKGNGPVVPTQLPQPPQPGQPQQPLQPQQPTNIAEDKARKEANAAAMKATALEKTEGGKAKISAENAKAAADSALAAYTASRTERLPAETLQNLVSVLNTMISNATNLQLLKSQFDKRNESLKKQKLPTENWDETLSGMMELVRKSLGGINPGTIAPPSTKSPLPGPGPETTRPTKEKFFNVKTGRIE